MMRLALVGAVVAGLAMTSAAKAEPTYRVLTFDSLDGWEADDHNAALRVFLDTCPDMKDPDWSPICALATNQ